jgi:hypothetical protein
MSVYPSDPGVIFNEVPAGEAFFAFLAETFRQPIGLITTKNRCNRQDCLTVEAKETTLQKSCWKA